MKKVSKRTLSAVLCLSFLATPFAVKRVSENKVSADVGGDGYTVWSATSAEKIMKEEVDYANKGAASLSYHGVRNEYENAQLIITTDATTEISSYYLEKADLIGPSGAVIEEENIDVYNQSYVECLTCAANPQNYYFGWVPDALVPIDFAKEANELKVDKKSNQGLWITVYIPKDIPAGVYTSEFELTVAEDTYDIPVSVTVEDYTLTDEAHTGTFFAVWDDSLMGSELDDTIEMKTKYFEFLLDYRMVGSLPIESLDADEIVRVVNKYWDHPVFTDYVIPHNNCGIAGNGLPLEMLQKSILALAAGSTVDRNLLSKGWMYYMDEIDGTIGFQNGWNNFVNVERMLEQTVSKIEGDTTGAYDNFKQIEDWKNTILGIDELLTVNPANSPDWVYEKSGIICPGWVFSESMQDFIAENMATYDTEWWWYGCSGPTATYPTYHINDPNLISSRFINWLQYDYHVTGVLYWATASAGNSYETPFYHWGSEINDCEPSFSLGDGFLVYAGAKYGHSGPIPSIRLMSVRDGLEEYELIYDLNEGYKAKGLSEEIARANIMSIYDSLHDAVFIDNDAEAFMACRDALIENVLAMDSPHGFMLKHISVENNVATVTMQLNEGYTMTVNGNAPTKVSSTEYTYALNLNDATSITVQITSESGSESYTINKFISNKSVVLNGFESVEEQAKIYVSTNSTATVVTEGDMAGTMKFNVSSVFTGDAFEDLYFEPTVKVNLTDLGSYQISDFDSISFTLWNKSAEKVEFDVYVTHGSMRTYVMTVTLAVGANAQVASLRMTGYKNVDGISFVFKNAGNATTPKGYEFYMDNMNGYVED